MGVALCCLALLINPAFLKGLDQQLDVTAAGRWVHPRWRQTVSATSYFLHDCEKSEDCTLQGPALQPGLDGQAPSIIP